MAAKITLVRKGTDPDAVPGGMAQHAWLLIVEATGNLIPSDIFIWHARANQDGMPDSVFEAVASVHQLMTVPTEHRRVRNTLEVCPFFRTARVELFCRSAEEANLIWLRIKEEVRQLVINWNLKDTLVTSSSVVTDGSSSTVVEGDSEILLEDNPVQVSDFVFDEAMDGVVDGTNRTFGIANPAAPNTLQVFRNGVRVYGEGEDYEQAGQVIVMRLAPTLGSRMTANYILEQ